MRDITSLSLFFFARAVILKTKKRISQKNLCFLRCFNVGDMFIECNWSFKRYICREWAAAFAQPISRYSRKNKDIVLVVIVPWMETRLSSFVSVINSTDKLHLTVPCALRSTSGVISVASLTMALHHLPYQFECSKKKNFTPYVQKQYKNCVPFLSIILKLRTVCLRYLMRADYIAIFPFLLLGRIVSQ